MIRDKKISFYAGALMITLAGSLATILIVDTTEKVGTEAEYAHIDPFDMNANFGY